MDEGQTGFAMWEIEFHDEQHRRLNLLGPLRDLRPGEQESTNYYVNETFGEWRESTTPSSCRPRPVPPPWPPASASIPARPCSTPSALSH